MQGEAALAPAGGLTKARQKPQTAKGTLFVTLEDETGNVQIIVWPQVYEDHRSTILGARPLAVEGVCLLYTSPSPRDS